MNAWMGHAPRVFPFPLTIVTAVLTYGLLLPIHEWVTNPDVGVAIAMIVLMVFVYAIIYLYFRHVLSSPTTYRERLIGWIDGYVSVLHGIAGFGMAVYLFDNANFSGVPPGTKGYNLYWTYTFANTIYLFNTAGRGNIAGVTALGVLPGIIASVTGMVYITVMLVAVVVQFIHVPVFRDNDPPPPQKFSMYQPQKNRRAPRGGPGVPLYKRR